MKSEFENRLSKLKVESATLEQTLQIIEKAGAEFPCLSCPSKDGCGSFNWFTKWFGEKSNKKIAI